MRVVIAGGGTGGHLFPGIALAEEISTRHPANQVLFVGTRRGLEARAVPAAGYALETISARGLKGMGLWKQLQGVFRLPWSVVESWRILGRFKPQVVIGVGGYASGPLVLAAWLRRIPAALQEQNAIPGFTNRILGRLARAVFVAFEEARRWFPAAKVHLVGNPVRRRLLEGRFRNPTVDDRFSDDRFSVFVFGGSLGALGLNTRVLEALPFLVGVRERIDFVHQTGAADLERVKRGYADGGFRAEVSAFIEDMSGAYARASVVVCRAGATTLAELTICKKASILVPFPHATDGHQEVNARAMVAAGAAVMFRESELSGERLADTLRQLEADPARLRRMEREAGLLGRPEAARDVVDVCMEWTGEEAMRKW